MIVRQHITGRSARVAAGILALGLMAGCGSGSQKAAPGRDERVGQAGGRRDQFGGERRHGDGRDVRRVPDPRAEDHYLRGRRKRATARQGRGPRGECLDALEPLPPRDAR